MSSWCIGLKSPLAPGVPDEVGAAEVLDHERRGLVADGEIGEPGADGVLVVGLTRVSSSSRAARSTRPPRLSEAARKVTRVSTPRSLPGCRAAVRPLLRRRRRELRARGQRTHAAPARRRASRCSPTRGYHAARVDDIVKVAKTSHGTFYLYFANKEDLFRALAEDVAIEMRALADALPPMTPDADGRRRRCAPGSVSFADLYEHYGPVIRAWTEAEIGASEFGRLGTDVLTEFTRVLVDRVRTAAPTDLDPVVASIALVAMIERCNYYVLSDQVQIDRDDDDRHPRRRHPRRPLRRRSEISGGATSRTAVAPTRSGGPAGAAQLSPRREQPVSERSPSSSVGPVEGDGALGEHRDLVGDLQRVADVLLDESSVVPASRIAARFRYTSSMTIGARPSDSSSAMSSRGGCTSTRASDSMRCSPPESVPATCLRRSPSRGNSS